MPAAVAFKLLFFLPGRRHFGPGSACAFLTVLFLAALTGIGPGMGPGAGTAAAATAETPSRPPPPRPVLRIALDDNYPPYIFRNNTGAIEGLLPDVWQLWSKQTGIPVIQPG